MTCKRKSNTSRPWDSNLHHPRSQQHLRPLRGQFDRGSSDSSPWRQYVCSVRGSVFFWVKQRCIKWWVEWWVECGNLWKSSWRQCSKSARWSQQRSKCSEWISFQAPELLRLSFRKCCRHANPAAANNHVALSENWVYPPNVHQYKHKSFQLKVDCFQTNPFGAWWTSNHPCYPRLVDNLETHPRNEGVRPNHTAQTTHTGRLQQIPSTTWLHNQIEAPWKGLPEWSLQMGLKVASWGPNHNLNQLRYLQK